MKEYYFLKGKDQSGPFSIEELANKGLTNETLIWTEGMENWQKLKDTPELAQTIKQKSVPPPPPFNTDDKISRTEVSGQLRVTTEKTPNPTLEAIKPNKTTLTWLIIWCTFNLFALLMSYSGIDFFNRRGEPRTDKFWPFVEYKNCPYVDKSLCDWSNTYKNFQTGEEETYYSFNGIFNEYDWTEFAFYVGGAILIYLLIRISNRDEQKIKD